MQAEAHSTRDLSRDANSQQTRADCSNAFSAAAAAAAAVATPSDRLFPRLPSSGLHSTQKWKDIPQALSPASSASSAVPNSVPFVAHLPTEAERDASPATAPSSLSAVMMAVVYLVFLPVASVLYFITGDASFFKVPAMVYSFIVSSALHLEKTVATTKRQVVDQMHSWLALFTVTAIRSLLSDAAAAVFTAVARCKSIFAQLKHDCSIAISRCKSTLCQLKQDFPSHCNTVWTSSKDLGVTIQCTGRTGIADIKNTAFRSLRALYQLAASAAVRSLRALYQLASSAALKSLRDLVQMAANAEQMCPGIFIFIFSLITASMLLMLEDSYPLQVLQALLSACTIAVVLAALCELSGGCDIFILAIVYTVIKFSIQTAMCAVSTATHRCIPAALREALLSSNTANVKMPWCNSKLSSLVSAFMACNVVLISKSSAQKHSEPSNSQQAFTFAASPVAVDTTTPVLTVSKRSTAAVAASEPLPPTSQVNTLACILTIQHSCCVRPTVYRHASCQALWLKHDLTFTCIHSSCSLGCKVSLQYMLYG